MDLLQIDSCQMPTWIILSFCSAIFLMGLLGILIRKNTLIIFMCLELMLSAVNLTYVTFSKQLSHSGGQMSVLFIITVAAAESAIGLGLLVALFRTRRSIDTDDIQLLRD